MYNWIDHKKIIDGGNTLEGGMPDSIKGEGGSGQCGQSETTGR